MVVLPIAYSIATHGVLYPCWWIMEISLWSANQIHSLIVLRLIGVFVRIVFAISTEWMKTDRTRRTSHRIQHIRPYSTLLAPVDHVNHSFEW